MSGKCAKGGDDCLECRCKVNNEKRLTIKEVIELYGLNTLGCGENIKVWIQMFFNDGSITEGKYIDVEIFDRPEARNALIIAFLNDTRRTEGYVLMWGGGKVYYKKATLSFLRRGPFKGSQTLRLRNI